MISNTLFYKIAFPVLAVLIIVRLKKFSKIGLLYFILAYVYCMILAGANLFPLVVEKAFIIHGGYMKFKPYFIPFSKFFSAPDTDILKLDFLQAFQIISLGIPGGVLIAAKIKSIKKFLIAAAAAGVSIEIAKLIVAVATRAYYFKEFNPDNITFFFIGATIGLGLYKLIIWILEKYQAGSPGLKKFYNALMSLYHKNSIASEEQDDE